MRDHLSDTFDELSATLGVRAVVLTGAGEKHFCTGRRPRRRAEAGAAPARRRPRPALGDVARMIRRGWQRLVASILDCEKPVIAAVNGTAAGGGANLVLACDLVVMADPARLIEVFVRARDHPRRRRLLPPPAHRRSPAGQGADVPRRRAVRGRLRALGHRQPRRARPPTSPPPSTSWPARLAAGPTRRSP